MVLEIERSKKITIGEKTYVIEFPNVGELMEIEAKKVMLGGGVYKELVMTGTLSSSFNLDLIDALSHYNVLIPDLIKDLGIDNFLLMDIITSKTIVRSYKKDFYPWYKGLLEYLYDDSDDDVETK